MTDQHRALHDQWAMLKRIDGLRARIEALEAGATCPHIVSSDEGTSYCRLAQQNAPTTEDFLMGAPNALRAVRNFGREIGATQIARSADSLPVKNQPTVKDSLTHAPACSLVEMVGNVLCNMFNDQTTFTDLARAAIREVAEWLENEHESPLTVDVLMQEADR